MNTAKTIFIALLFLLIFFNQDKSMSFSNYKIVTIDELNRELASNNTLIKGIALRKLNLSDKNIDSKEFKNCEFEDINAKEITLKNLTFENCDIRNSNFRLSKLENVTFKKCKLSNTVFNEAKLDNVTFINSEINSTDPNTDNSYRDLQGGDIAFITTKLTNIDFYHSKGRFVFDKSKLDDVGGLGLKEGSSLIFTKTDANDIDFSGSNLTELSVVDSVITNSLANNCTIDEILLNNSKLDFAIGDGYGYKKVVSKNTGSVIFGGTPVDQMIITGCPKDTRTIMVGGDTFNSITIEDCNPDELIFFESNGKTINIKNVITYTLDFSQSNIEHLSLENIEIKSELLYEEAQINNFEQRGIKFDTDATQSNDGANITITPTN